MTSLHYIFPLMAPTPLRRAGTLGHRARVVSGGLALLLTVSLVAACSSDPTTTDAASSSTDPAATVAPSTTPPTTRASFSPVGSGRALPARTTGSAPATPGAAGTEAVTAAITKAVPTIVAQADKIDAPTLLVASNIGATYGIPELAALRSQAVAKFAKDPDVSELVLYLSAPFYRRMVFPDAPVTAGDVALLPTTDATSRTLWVWATAFACDTPAFPSDWSQRVRDTLDQDPRGSYTAASAGLGLASLLERGCSLPDADALRAQIVTRIQGILPTPFVANDNALEAAVVLQLLGRGDLITPEMVTNTLNAQLPDGSWGRKATQDDRQGDWHATLMAVWMLEAARNPQATGPFFS